MARIGQRRCLLEVTYSSVLCNNRASLPSRSGLRIEKNWHGRSSFSAKHARRFTVYHVRIKMDSSIWHRVHVCFPPPKWAAVLCSDNLTYVQRSWLSGSSNPWSGAVTDIPKQLARFGFWILHKEQNCFLPRLPLKTSIDLLQLISPCGILHPQVWKDFLFTSTC